MKFAVVLSFVSLAFGSALFERDCAGNNCNREITGTRNGLPASSIRMSDCSSFQMTVVTPSPVTMTVTVEASDTPSSAAKRGLEIRQTTVIPQSLPTYATACSSAAEYASACSCWGITPTVSTASTPTVTVTSTVEVCDDL
jgi:hypothetical protein